MAHARLTTTVYHHTVTRIILFVQGFALRQWQAQSSIFQSQQEEEKSECNERRKLLVTSTKLTCRSCTSASLSHILPPKERNQVNPHKETYGTWHVRAYLHSVPNGLLTSNKIHVVLSSAIRHPDVQIKLQRRPLLKHIHRIKNTNGTIIRKPMYWYESNSL